MTTELWATLIGAVVLLLTNTAAAIKLWGELQKTKADRASTKEARDKDSLELHDKVLNLEFRSTQNKDNIQLLFEQVSDSNMQISLPNTQLATDLINIDSVIDALRELREEVMSK